MAPRAAVFDLDGTLLDTLDDIADAANRVLAARGFPTHGKQSYRYFVGDGIEKLIRRALPAGKRDDDSCVKACLEAFRDDYGSNWDVSTRPYEGVPEMLNGLASRGIRMAVLSNKPDDFTRMCVSELLPDWEFDIVLGQRDGIPVKPDPAGAHMVAARLGVTPPEIIYLGDTGIDMTTASRAGMVGIGAAWGFRNEGELREHGARAVISHPLQFLEFFDKQPT